MEQKSIAVMRGHWFSLLASQYFLPIWLPLVLDYLCPPWVYVCEKEVTDDKITPEKCIFAFRSLLHICRWRVAGDAFLSGSKYLSFSSLADFLTIRLDIAHICQDLAVGLKVCPNSKNVSLFIKVSWNLRNQNNQNLRKNWPQFHGSVKYGYLLNFLKKL